MILLRSATYRARPILLLAALLPNVGCSDSGNSEGAFSDGATSSTDQGTGGASSSASAGVQPVGSVNSITVGTGTNTTGSMMGAGGGPGPYHLPPGFTETEFGGYKLGEPTDGIDSGTGGTSGEGCGTTIVGVVRDFKRGDEDGGHDDFQTFTGNGEEGIVEEDLGSDRKPVYVDEDHEFTTGKENFDQWYRNVDGVNEAYAVSFSFEPNGDVLTFHSGDFFPIDDVGFGNEGENHNFHFTTEVHAAFVYQGGETFTFTGDDDLWVFVNHKLAIDLGGLHPELSRTIDIDQEANHLGLELGGTYDLDLFHAERHTSESNFRVETNLAFTNCGEIIDEVIK
jgi:fibro-slime domain-containing protein